MRPHSRVVATAPVPSLTRWGASVDADLVYRCLLVFGARPAATLERDLGMQPLRVAHALEELAAMQAVGRRGTRWVALPAAEVVRSLHRRGSAHRRPRAGCRPGWQPALREVLPEPIPLDDGLRHLPSRALTRARLRDLVAVVRHEHLTMNPEPAYEEESARSAVPMDRTLLSRGVRTRVLGVHSLDGGDPLTVHGRNPGEPRPDYRQTVNLPLKLIVMDRRVALFPVSAENLDAGYLEVSQAPVVSALAALFERHWESAGQPQETIMRETSLTPREQVLVQLLAQGHTDASAAQALQISQRSVSGILRNLMDRLGVNNRFQLGLALGARHLLTPPSTMEEDR
ncbi:LuxR C-terminal-related transcriptional regulator [Micromonospora sp. CPCC 205371]|nr:LuxR C-terminal-related transcriptional regulator [Micromonospora sp. CPCC 205371]